MYVFVVTLIHYTLYTHIMLSLILKFPGIDSRWCHLGYFPWLHLKEPCALGSTQPLKMSTRDFSWGKGGWCVWLTTYHPCSAKRQENLGP